MTTLIAVRAALKLCDSTDAALFSSLLDGGKLMPYKSNEIAKTKFGSKEVQYPTFGKKQAHATLRQVQSVKELQDICLRDLSVAREYFDGRLQYFVLHNKADSSGGASDEEAGMQTINAMVDDNADPTKTAVTFPCETLDDMCTKGSEPPENLLHSTMTTCTVLPTNTMLPLHHSNEGITTTTLLAGSIVWVVWPPTPWNIDTLQAAYESVSDGFDEIKLDIANELEGGLTFVQTVGDGLRIPPFSLMMGLTTSTSVVASSSQVTVENFISMLSKLQLLKAWFQNEVHGAEKQSRFVASILHWLDLMLNGDPDDEDKDSFKLPHTKNGLLSDLLKKWDAVKDDLATMMGPADSKAVELIWEDFLVHAVGRECRICGVRIQNKQKSMKKHFVAKHWVEFKTAQHVSSSKSSEEGDAKSSQVALEHEADDVGEGDAMDLDN